MGQLHPDVVRFPARIASMAIAATFLLSAMLAGYRPHSHAPTPINPDASWRNLNG